MITSSDIICAARLLDALGDQSHGYLFNDASGIEGPYTKPRVVSVVNGMNGGGAKTLALISIDSKTGEIVAEPAE